MSTNDEKLENAFQHIERGNSFEEGENWWSAADSFGEAMSILKALSLEVLNNVGDKESTDDTVQEQMKISDLYESQSREYRARARGCFIKALTFENDEDRERKNGTTEKAEREPLCASISAEEAKRRLRIFSCLYSNETINAEEKEIEVEMEKEKGIYQKQDSLEERLRELNRTLPSGFKTSKERMSEINRGLSRLGLSSIYTQDETPTVEVHVPVSEEKQVEQIMAQARDEAKFELENEKGQRNQTETHDSADIDIEVSSSEESSDDGDELYSDSEEDRTHRRKRKAAKRKVIKAQVKLTELMALLDFEPTDKSVGDDESVGDNGSSEEGESKSGKGFDLEPGRRTLVKAKLYLDKALRELTAD